jgi:hypothetical protein
LGYPHPTTGNPPFAAKAFLSLNAASATLTSRTAFDFYRPKRVSRQNARMMQFTPQPIATPHRPFNEHPATSIEQLALCHSLILG